MITVIAKNYISDDKIDEMIRLTEELVVETRKEEGCISYTLYQDDKDKGEFTFVEEWSSKAMLDQHMASEHFKRIVPQMKKLTYAEGHISIINKIH